MFISSIRRIIRLHTAEPPILPLKTEPFSLLIFFPMRKQPQSKNMTKISHIATIHRKPKDAYVPELTPSAIDIPADLNGKPIFLDSEKNTPSISHSYVTGFDTFSFPSDTIVDSSKYPNYTTVSALKFVFSISFRICFSVQTLFDF